VWVSESSAAKVFPTARREEFVVGAGGKIACLACSDQVLDRGQFAPASGVTVDHCGGCGGLWLDAFEARALESALALGALGTKKATVSPRPRPAAPAAAAAPPTLLPGSVLNTAYDDSSFWPNVPRAIAMPFTFGRLFLLLFPSAALVLGEFLGCLGLPLLFVGVGLYLFVCLRALVHGANGTRQILGTDDYDGLWSSILMPLVQISLALGISLVGSIVVFTAFPEQRGALFFAVVAWSVLSTPVVLMVVALSDGIFPVLNPLRWWGVLRARPGQFIAVALLFNALHLVGGVAQVLLEFVPVAGGALGVWLGMAVSVAACHLLGVWVFCNRDRLYN
jgi:hypothetical protein